MIIVDVETTGLNPKNHSIVSIGAVDFSNPDNQLYLECRPWNGAEISERALEINGFTRNGLADTSKLSLYQVIEEFIEWAKGVEDHTIGGQNVGGFDVKFLQSSADRYSLDFKFGHRTRDLHSTACDAFDRLAMEIPLKGNKSDLSLDNILQFAGLSPEPRPHNVLTGAKLEAEAYSRLIFGRNLLSEYTEFTLPDYLV